MATKKVKMRFVITAVVEYEANPANYSNCSTPEEMLELDLRNAHEDTFLFLEGGAKWDIKGEVVNDGS